MCSSSLSTVKGRHRRLPGSGLYLAQVAPAGGAGPRRTAIRPRAGAPPQQSSGRPTAHHPRPSSRSQPGPVGFHPLSGGHRAGVSGPAVLQLTR